MVKTFQMLCARKQCSIEFMAIDKRRKYCSQSCAAIDSNTRRPRKTRKCLECDVDTKNTKYCSNKCSSKHLSSLRRNSFDTDAWLDNKVPADNKNGVLSGRAKRILCELANWKCTECGWGEPNPKLGRPILAIDHIDGNHRNNMITNLKVLCYNCHTLTPTFGALNIGTISPVALDQEKIISCK